MKVEQGWEICRSRLAADQARGNLFEAYKTNRSCALRNRLAIANDGLACKEAHRQAKICDVPYEDLEQIARIGLLQAIERYDARAGHAFSSFAVPWIRGEIQHFLRDRSWDMVKVPRRAIETASAVRKVKRWAIACGRSDITDEQAAMSLGISSEKWREVAELTARKPIIDLNETVQVAGVSEEETIQQQAVRTAVAKLPDPYRGAIVGVYFKGLTEAVIAQQSNVELMQVRLWIEEGLQRLRSGHLGERRTSEL